MTLHLTLSLAGSGYHPAPGSYRRSRTRRAPLHSRRLARAAEAAGWMRSCWEYRSKAPSLSGSDHANTMQLDPLPLLGSMIAVTRRIGLGRELDGRFHRAVSMWRVCSPRWIILSYGRTAWIARMFDTDALLPLIGKPSRDNDVARLLRSAPASSSMS